MHITGNASEAVANNIQALVDLSRYPCRPPKAQYGLIRRQITGNSTDALQAMGYYDSQLSLSADEGDDCVSVTLDVNTGPPVILKHVQVEITGDAAQDPAFSRLVEQAQLATGQRLQHDRYSNLKKPATTPDQPRLRPRRADCPHPQGGHKSPPGQHYAACGQRPRYHFGEVTVNGSALNPSLINAYVSFQEGEPYDSGRMLETQQSFLGAGYFSAVRVQKGEPNDTTRRIPVSIALTDNNRWSLLTGVGISTDTGPRVRLG